MSTFRAEANATEEDPTTVVTHILEVILGEKPESNLHRFIFGNDGLTETFLEILEANSVDILRTVPVPPPQGAGTCETPKDLPLSDFSKLEVLQQFYLYQVKHNGIRMVWGVFTNEDYNTFRTKGCIPRAGRQPKPPAVVMELEDE